MAIRKDIVTRNVAISGQDTVCASGAVYTLPDNMSASSWTLLQGADSAFSLTFTPDSAVVTLSDFSGNAAATLVALV
ncbi:MAG: hypothetical protein LBD91_07435, partial [Prevotellaceae bacterium]|nr:hypothetical protein [Prevotellaceae bacterium]